MAALLQCARCCNLKMTAKRAAVASEPASTPVFVLRLLSLPPASMIHFKFSKGAGYDTINFTGIGMKLSELKAEIMRKKGIVSQATGPHAPAVDLVITNAETNAGVRCSPLQTVLFVPCARWLAVKPRVLLSFLQNT